MQARRKRDTETAAPRPVIVAAIGNAPEWYDFVVYGFLTVIIARLFFQAQDEPLLSPWRHSGVGFSMHRSVALCSACTRTAPVFIFRAA